MLSVERSLLKGEAPRFPADFSHPLSCERFFKSLLDHIKGLVNQQYNCNIGEKHSWRRLETDKNMDRDTDVETDTKGTRLRTQISQSWQRFSKGQFNPIVPMTLCIYR
jgi:hypothetical protein